MGSASPFAANKSAPWDVSADRATARRIKTAKLPAYRYRLQATANSSRHGLSPKGTDRMTGSCGPGRHDPPFSSCLILGPAAFLPARKCWGLALHAAERWAIVSSLPPAFPFAPGFSTCPRRASQEHRERPVMLSPGRLGAIGITFAARRTAVAWVRVGLPCYSITGPGECFTRLLQKLVQFRDQYFDPTKLLFPPFLAVKKSFGTCVRSFTFCFSRRPFHFELSPTDPFSNLCDASELAFRNVTDTHW